MAEVIKHHIKCHVTAPSIADKECTEAADDLIEVMDVYLKLRFVLGE